MTLESFHIALQEFQDAGGVADTKESASPEAIDQVAKALRLNLPPSVIEFYKKYEWVEVGPDEFIPLTRLEQAAASERSLPTPFNYLPILADGGGGVYFVVAQNRGSTRPDDFGIVIYRPSCSSSDYEYKARNIFEFAISRIIFWQDEL